MIIKPEMVIDELTPSLGYFGSSTADALVINLNAPIKGVRVSLAENNPEILNIMGLQLLQANNPVAIDANSCVFSQSSIHQNDEKFANASLLALSGIHSTREKNPFWQVVFSSPINADAVRIFNRGDEWGVRSRSLVVSVLENKSDTWVQIFDLQSSASVLSSLYAGIAAANGIDIGPNDCSKEIRKKITENVAERINAGALPLDEVDWRKLMHFLPVWSKEPLTVAELTIIAAKILHQKIRHGKASLRDSAFMLRKSTEILALQDKVNSVARDYNHSSVLTISRHGLQHSKLQSKAKEYVAHIGVVVDILSELGLSPVLAYGTLLGAVRDKCFIPHDDDVDLLYQVNAVDRTSAELAMVPVFQKFEEMGFDIVRFPGTLNVHVVDKKAGVSVDIFPCWDVNGETSLHMERMKIRSIPTSLLYPSTTLEFYDQTFPVPADPQGFLQERYGDGWGVSNQFFEWPWALTE